MYGASGGPSRGRRVEPFKAENSSPRRVFHSPTTLAAPQHVASEQLTEPSQCNGFASRACSRFSSPQLGSARGCLDRQKSCFPTRESDSFLLTPDSLRKKIIIRHHVNALFAFTMKKIVWSCHRASLRLLWVTLAASPVNTSHS